MVIKTQMEKCHPLNHPYGSPWHPGLAMVSVQELAPCLLKLRGKRTPVSKCTFWGAFFKLIFLSLKKF